MLGVALLAGPVMADDTEPPASFHQGQFGVSARVALGARGIVTYENNVFCGDTDPQAQFGFATVCTGRSPLALDLEGSYGVTPTIELLLSLRVGIESDVGDAPSASGPRPLQLAPGARFFFSESRGAKLFLQPQLVLDLADYQTGKDIGVRALGGLWIDLHRTYGIYFFLAPSLGFSRWLSATIEGGIGFQARYP